MEPSSNDIVMDLRWKCLFEPFKQIIAGKNVLELAPSDGWFTRRFLDALPSELHVVELNSSAVDVLTGPLFSHEIDAGILKVHHADGHLKIYQFDPGQFAVVICAGFLYHTPHTLWVIEGMARLNPEYIFIETFDQEVGFFPEIINERGMRQSDHQCVPMHLGVPKSLLLDWMKSLEYEIFSEIDTTSAALPSEFPTDNDAWARTYFNRWKNEYAIWFRKEKSTVIART